MTALPRVLEPEVMDTAREALEYDSMDHAQVNSAFVSDMLACSPVVEVALDVGCGTARIPLELATRRPDAFIHAVDLALEMLRVAEENVARSPHARQIQLESADAKALPYLDQQFSSVFSNSLVHHVPQPELALAEMWRVLRKGGLLFVRDLIRPDAESDVASLVALYAAEASGPQRALFDASLRAALRVEEVAQIVACLGVPAKAVAQTSDRHWTLAWRKE